MNTKIVKLIAREGIIISTIIAVMLLLLPAKTLVVRNFNKQTEYHSQLCLNIIKSGENIASARSHLFEARKIAEKRSKFRRYTDYFIIYLLASYPAYWLIRFMAWIVKTIKDKSRQ